MRTKGREFVENRPGYYALLTEQIKEPAFRSMSEILLGHAPKGKRAPEVNVAVETPQVREAVKHVIYKGWPVVLYYEFRWLTSTYGACSRIEGHGTASSRTFCARSRQRLAGAMVRTVYAASRALA